MSISSTGIQSQRKISNSPSESDRTIGTSKSSFSTTTTAETTSTRTASTRAACSTNRRREHRRTDRRALFEAGSRMLQFNLIYCVTRFSAFLRLFWWSYGICIACISDCLFVYLFNGILIIWKELLAGWLYVLGNTFESRGERRCQIITFAQGPLAWSEEGGQGGITV